MVCVLGRDERTVVCRVVAVSCSGEGRWACDSRVTSRPKPCYLLASYVTLRKFFNLSES